MPETWWWLAVVKNFNPFIVTGVQMFWLTSKASAEALQWFCSAPLLLFALRCVFFSGLHTATSLLCLCYRRLAYFCQRPWLLKAELPGKTISSVIIFIVPSFHLFHNLIGWVALGCSSLIKVCCCSTLPLLAFCVAALWCAGSSRSIQHPVAPLLACSFHILHFHCRALAAVEVPIIC